MQMLTALENLFWFNLHACTCVFEPTITQTHKEAINALSQTPRNVRSNTVNTNFTNITPLSLVWYRTKRIHFYKTQTRGNDNAPLSSS